jgi:hypothetical protein
VRERLQEFSLSLHSEKTRLIEFGRHAADRRARHGLGKPETFKFSGFTHICGQSRRGKFRALQRRSQKDRTTRERIAKVAPTISRSLQPFIHGRTCVLPSHTQGGSRVREFRSRGSVRGAVGNGRPLYVADCLANKNIC